MAEYLQLAITLPDSRHDWDAIRDRAYRLAHLSRQNAQAALLDPPPARMYAAEALPHALTLEALADEVTAIANLVDGGAYLSGDQEVTELKDRIQAASRDVAALHTARTIK